MADGYKLSAFFQIGGQNMEKIINIEGVDLKLNNQVAWTMEYKDQFGKDIVPVIMPMISAIVEGLASVISETDTNNLTAKQISEAFQGRSMEILLPMFQVEFVDIILNVTWALAKCADETIPEPKRWIRQFETFPLDVIVPEVYELVMQGFVSSKNWERLKDVSGKLKVLRP